MPITIPKILIIPGSVRTESFNVRLAALAAKELALMDVEATRISLADYPLPIYDADFEPETGVPYNALKLKQLVSAHQGVFITSPEYNASITPLLKNTIDWIGKVRERGELLLAAYRGRAFAIGAASSDPSGGLHSLMTLRQVLTIGCRALVVPEQVAVPNAREAFGEMDELRDPRMAGQLKLVIRQLVDTARMMERGGL